MQEIRNWGIFKGVIRIGVINQHYRKISSLSYMTKETAVSKWLKLQSVVLHCYFLIINNKILKKNTHKNNNNKNHNRIPSSFKTLYIYRGVAILNFVRTLYTYKNRHLRVVLSFLSLCLFFPSWPALQFLWGFFSPRSNKIK